MQCSQHSTARQQLIPFLLILSNGGELHSSLVSFTSNHVCRKVTDISLCDVHKDPAITDAVE